jgi:hypothetical protein
MADRKELARQYMALQQESKIDEALTMLADDVVANNPMTGTATGKAAVEQQIRNRPPGGQMQLEWGEPVQEGDDIKIVASGSPFGPIRVLIGFNAEDKINKFDIGLGA